MPFFPFLPVKCTSNLSSIKDVKRSNLMIAETGENNPFNFSSMSLLKSFLRFFQTYSSRLSRLSGADWTSSSSKKNDLSFISLPIKT